MTKGAPLAGFVICFVTIAVEALPPCECTGSNKGFNAAGIRRFNDVKLFPADYGTECKAWDKVECPKAWPEETYGPWCCSSWCYVSNGTCADAIASTEAPGLFYSYFRACGADADEVNQTNCPLHHSWGMGSRSSEYMKQAWAAHSMVNCGGEDPQDTTEVKRISLILGMAVVGSGLGLLFFVWVIRCDRRELFETLCAGKKESKSEVESSDVIRGK
mmetsp:Transcript_41793/g.102944  ORF Transcript_41793/g.102944 Transcript_41793/m.102944 type:complete len:217 (-) Transcript_41793:110-760(-)|eukprot:CAMPEP_0197591616 /NCGR_PEP_ID=MMETSP1326-20131121/13815_1 /TAXON_ID=1155430 /ORGANISM="Genus nov. species nov., Strain RCC2288" /LENGTH=216 /DNA_ID=CAMNT_0043157145 /DNA_START=317 /DNA_END=967 /DNA_ORIENTATION=+